MSSSFVTGPCLIYAGIPTNLSNLIPVVTQQNVLQAGLGGVGGAQLQAQAQGGGPLGMGGLDPLPGAQLQNNPGAGLQNNQREPPDSFLLLLRRVNPLYLGTCEDTPLVDFDPAYVPVMRDETGSTHPWDRIYDGEEATIVADLTRWNEPVYAMLAAKAASGIINLPTVPRGLDWDGYIGTLMATEGGATPLWLVFPYAAKPGFGLAGMPPGYRFFATLLLSDGLGPLSARPRKIRLVWRAVRLLASGVVVGLYDHNIRGLPRPN